ncbi:MAG: exodeoxyribonuclease VII small subunit, partial [Candidatus Curtissbacteria bacterium]|nr:exodeoxyribonuclease VII small subunit [Candidatus Curtissbacteria bacterium]
MSSKKQPTLDQAYQQLQTIVKEFESQEIDLEKSIPKFKKGLELAKFLEDKLSKIKNEVQEIKDKFTDQESKQSPSGPEPA